MRMKVYNVPFAVPRTMNEYVLELTPQPLFLTTLIWHGAAPGKVQVRSVPVRAVLAAREEAVGEPGEGVRVVGVVSVVGVGPVVNGMISLPVFGWCCSLLIWRKEEQKREGCKKHQVKPGGLYQL